MVKRVSLVVSGILIGACAGYFITFYIPRITIQQIITPLAQFKLSSPKKQVIGFLPYWLLDKASPDYSPYITTLTYFGLSVDNDGTILKLTNPQELQPGWSALKSGKVDPFLQNAKKHTITRSLLLDTGDSNTINILMADPVVHARNLIRDVKPLLKHYSFSDLNLDIEYTQEASSTARLHFTQFIQEVRRNLDPKITLTIEVSPVDVIKKQLIDIQSVGKIADYTVIMAYDYHSTDSSVTGPVAPLFGAGVTSEYDVATAVVKAVSVIPSQKIVLGIPLYGYEWETINNIPRSAIIPGTGLSASNRRAEQFLASCASCSATFDTSAQESFLIYKDQDTKTYHQLFYPDKQATLAKVTFSSSEQLGGIALWALGYEGKTLLNPLQAYKK